MRVATSFMMLAAMAAVFPARSAGAASDILLDVGLVITGAAQGRGVDYEVISTVVAVSREIVTLETRWPEGGESREAFSVQRIIERRDLEEANRIIAYLHVQDPPRFPGATSGQTSRAVLAALKRDEAVPIVFGTASGPLGLLGARKYFRGELRRVERGTVPVNVLLNGVPVSLASIHAAGRLSVGTDSGEANFWWLDQEDNAITLLWTFKDSEVRVIRIDTPLIAPAAESGRLAERLDSDLCRVDLHGIFFDLGSAVLLPQSMGEISVVADLLNAHPGWHLTVEGHTDSLGTDGDNLVLSRNRAEAVRAALVTGHGIAPGQLAVMGFGESRPRDTNDTLEGRARNRRVELAKECP